MLRKLLFGVAALAALGFAPSAKATVFTLDDFTGDSATAKIEVTEQAGGALRFNATLEGGTTGDIRGVWFNVDGGIDLGSLSATLVTVNGSSSLASTTAILYGTPSDLPNDAELTPRVFDFGVVIGGPGNDNISSVVFDLTSSDGPLSLSSFFREVLGTKGNDEDKGEQDVIGLRLKSTSGREGSSKLSGGFPPDGPPAKVPEPGMLLLFGAGLLALGLASRRRMA